MKCEICGKIPLYGHNVSHSKRRTNKRSLPNIHAATVTVGGQAKKMSLCTRCLRTKNKMTKTAA